MEETPTPKPPPAAIIGLDGQNWQRTVVLLLAIINYVMGEPGHAKLQKTLDQEALLILANQLMTGTYQPREWFQPDSHLGDKNFIQQFPTNPQADTTYCLPTLPGEDSLTETLNLRSGGVIYEDPFWFLLAAYNINKTADRFIIPRPTNPQNAWQSRLEVLAALHNDQYRADEWFTEAQPLTATKDQKTRFIDVIGEDLVKLRTAGRGTLVDSDLGVGGYVLYEYKFDD